MKFWRYSLCDFIKGRYLPLLSVCSIGPPFLNTSTNAKHLFSCDGTKVSVEGLNLRLRLINPNDEERFVSSCQRLLFPQRDNDLAQVCKATKKEKLQITTFRPQSVECSELHVHQNRPAPCTFSAASDVASAEHPLSKQSYHFI